MNITLMTCWDDKYAPLADIAVPNMMQYCNKHGYLFHSFRYHTDHRRLKSFGDRGKIAQFLSMYREGDLIMWLDVDALVMNSEIKVEDQLAAHGDFLWTYDRHGPLSGFWIARCTPDVKNFFEEIAEVAARSTSLHVFEKGPPDVVLLQVEPHGISDQSAMRQLMSVPPFSAVAGNCVPGRRVGHCFGWGDDPYCAYEPGAWLQTWPGGSPEEKLVKMKGAENHAK